MNASSEFKTDLQVSWFKNSYACTECGTKWTDEWSCTCDDRCPGCDAEIEPFKSFDLGRALDQEDYQGAARMIYGSPAEADAVTAEEAKRFGESILEGGQYRFREWLDSGDRQRT